MKTYGEVENVLDALEGHSDETVPKSIASAVSLGMNGLSPKYAVITALRWVLDKERN